MNKSRRFWVLVHRYAGLYMVVFLIVAGLTGTILAFDHELSLWLNPELTRVPVQNRPPLDLFTLRDLALQKVPHSRMNFMEVNYQPGEVVSFMPEPLINSATGKPYELGCVMIFLDPYTGAETARLKSFDDWPINRRNFIPFVFALHSCLHFGHTGGILFGIAALVWTFDCFIGFFLTLPRPLPKPATVEPGFRSRTSCVAATPRRRGVAATPPSHDFDLMKMPSPILATRASPPPFCDGASQPLPGNFGIRVENPSPHSATSWWSRWQPAWKIVWRGKAYRIHFNLHRAVGLWIWPLLLVFAISTVSFNLPQVYFPVMKTLFHLEDVAGNLPNLPAPIPDPALSWRDAAVIGQKLAEEQARQHHFKLSPAKGHIYFSYDPAKGIFTYGAHGERDIGTYADAVTVYFDGQTGALRGAIFASGENAARTFTNWVCGIHGCTIGGFPMQIIVGITGILIAVLSITGIYLWWEKIGRPKRPATGGQP